MRYCLYRNSTNIVMFFDFLKCNSALSFNKTGLVFKAVGFFFSYRVRSFAGLTRVTARNAVGVTVYVRMIYRTDAAHAANG
jgi:hypothetical protein